MGKQSFYPSNKRSGAKPCLVKRQWTPQEDQLLKGLVEKHGVKRWSYIADMIDGRIGKQCRERWNNHLRPHIKKDSWSEEEEKALVEAHAIVGNKWAAIAKMIPGRTENSIKNHWNATKRKQLSKGNCRRSIHNEESTVLQEYISRIVVMEHGRNETKGSNIQNDPFSFLEGYLKNTSEQSQGVFKDADLPILFEWPLPPPSCFTLEGENLGMETEAFPTEIKQVKREMDLMEMIYNSEN